MIEQKQTIEEKKAILAQYNYPYEEFQKLEELRGYPIELFDEKITIEFDEFCSQKLCGIKPIVTVLMATYNHEKYIAEAIESVVNQECDFPFELVIIEDHSSDNTLEICKDYQRRYPNHIRLFTPRERRPFILAKMLTTPKYIDHIRRGKYTAYCEGDDFWCYPQKLQKQFEFMEANPQYSFCMHGFNNLNMMTGEYYRNWMIEDFPKSGEDFAHRLALGEQLLGTLSLFLRESSYRKILDNLKRDTIAAPMGDVQLFFHLALIGNVKYFSEYWATYRIIPSSATCKGNSVKNKLFNELATNVVRRMLINSGHEKWWEERLNLPSTSLWKYCYFFLRSVYHLLTLDFIRIRKIKNARRNCFDAYLKASVHNRCYKCGPTIC